MLGSEDGFRVRLASQTGILRPPKVSLEQHGEELVLRFDVPRRYELRPTWEWGWHPVRDRSGLLEQFVKLPESINDTKGREKIRQFAEKWGPLWILQPHTPSSRPTFLSLWPPNGSIAEWPAYESVLDWRTCIAEAKSRSSGHGPSSDEAATASPPTGYQNATIMV